MSDFDFTNSGSLEETLLAVHGDGDCHICNLSKRGEGSSFCSYPHGMVPVNAVDEEHPEGFWTWLRP